MPGYKVNIDSTVIDEHSSDVEYGDWSCEKVHYLGATALRTSEYPDIASDLDIPSGTSALFVVWAIWSTGDSFGFSKCDSAEAMGIFVDEGAAKQLRTALETFTQTTGPDRDWLVMTTMDGQHHKLRVPWMGYFEHLESIEINSVTIL